MIRLIVLSLIAGPCFGKNVILFIADGMSYSAVTAARIEARAQKKDLFLDTIANTAIINTESYGSGVTDSAASATAISTGVKTQNGKIGMGPKNEKLQSIAEWAKMNQMSVGIVTNTRLTHATPAAFYAHVTDRNQEDEIGSQLLSTNFDVALGGGAEHMDLKKAEEKFSVFRTKTALAKLGLRSQKPVLGVFAHSHMEYVKNRGARTGAEPSLIEMIEFAVLRLEKLGKPYLLVIEAGRIDHAGHDGLAEHMILETLQLDEGVRWVDKHLRASKISSEKNTTVFVTADHETGGFYVRGYFPDGVSQIGKQASNSKMTKQEKQQVYGFSAGEGSGDFVHTATDVPLYAWGKSAESVRGTWHQVQIFSWIKDRMTH